MKQKYFKVPFAQNGDKQSIVENSDSHGYVNYNDGFGPDYEKDLATDAQAKPPERNTFNELFNCITANIKQYQENGFPEFITAADNSGVSFAYSRLSVVNYDNKLYVSLTENNTALPGTDETKWQPFLYDRATQQIVIEGTDNESIVTPLGLSQFLTANIDPFTVPVGAVMMWPNATPPDGWLECNGQIFDTAKYPKLALRYPSGSLPDMRGQFPRGWANGSAVDPDSNRPMLSEQGDAIRNITGHFHIRQRSASVVDGAFKIIGTTGGGGNDSKAYVVEMDASLVVPVADENRPKNVAWMFIVKTDSSESAGASVPTNLIASPTTINAGIGATQQVTATVIPTSLGAQYPVSWSSSDTSVATVSNTGLITLVGTGTCSIIASISTGMTAIVSVTSNILLTSLSMASIPSLIVGDTHTVSLNSSPLNYTETVIYSSNDASVAYIDNSGQISAVGAGSVTISATGQVSGVTATRTVTVTEAVVPETYLQIANNLSDVVNPTMARNHLGLGALATQDGLTAVEVGAMPLATRAIQAGTDLNDITASGLYFQNVTSNATLELHYPQAVAGVLTVYKTGVDQGCRQEYMPYNSTNVYRRYAFGSPLNFSAWDKY